MSIFRVESREGWTQVIAASIPTEDVIVRSSVGYVPQFVTDTFGKTRRLTKDVTLARLLRILRKEFSDYELVSIGTPVNFDLAPTHLTRAEMTFTEKDQVEACLKEISVSDLLIRSRLQPSWDWQAPARSNLSVLLHVGWYDTVYFMQFKDIFLGEMHCRYSAKFGFDPRTARLTHFRYTDTGELEEVTEFSARESEANEIKEKVEFLRVFRDGSTERT